MSDSRLRVTQLGAVNEAQLLAALDDPTIRIVIADGNPPAEQQLLAEALVDLLARVFPRLAILCADGVTPSLAFPPSEATTLRDRLEQARSHGAIDPKDPGDPSLTVAISTFEIPEADLYVDASGWQSYLGRRPSQLPHPAPNDVPIGPLAAACRGAARAFRLVTADVFGSGPDRQECSYSSVLTHQAGEVPLAEPQLPVVGPIDAVLVGAGSIGGAAIYALARFRDLTGSLDICDPETLEGHNFDRAILATRAHVRDRAGKAAVAERGLAHYGKALSARGHQQTISEYVAVRPQTAVLPLVLCAVDSAAARRSVQDCLPLELINAACSQSEVQISRHVSDDGPCVCCLQMPDVMDESKIRARLIAEATGLGFLRAVALLVGAPPAPLDVATVSAIERHTGSPAGGLRQYIGQTLDCLWRERLLYGGHNVKAGETHAAVAAPWVTALAGVVLAGEALKVAGGDEYAEFRLGPEDGSPAIHYAENPYADPGYAQLSRPERYGEECLCRSPRRLALLHERYG